MNLTLHWLRRDFRRHAPLIALWALLVALFTCARIWFRTHPEVMLGDRDLWLSLPAAGLGFAEVCLLLRVLLDDPARGAHAFWKTRPPSGGAVFAAKAVIFAVVGLVIPLTAEAVFLSRVGMSSGGAERFSVYLLPTLLALLAGTAAVNWRMVSLWLPLGIAVPAGTFVGWAWLSLESTVILADRRICMAAALLVALAVAAWAYRRRTGGAVFAAAALVLPAVAAAGMAATGWLADPRLTTPPPGNAARDFPVTWHQQPQVGQNYEDRGWGVRLPFCVAALGAEEYVVGELSPVTLKPAGQAETEIKAMEGDRRFHGIAAFWNLRLDESLALSLQRSPWTATGTLYLRFYDRKHHSLPLKGTHTVKAGSSRWVITPASLSAQRRIGNYSGDPSGRFWIEYEFTSSAPWSLLEDAFIDSETARLKRAAGDVNVRLDGFYLRRDFLLWEGAGRGGIQRGFGTAQEIHELYEPATWSSWTLELDTLTLSGTLELPFSLTWPEAKP